MGILSPPNAVVRRSFGNLKTCFGEGCRTGFREREHSPFGARLGWLNRRGHGAHRRARTLVAGWPRVGVFVAVLMSAVLGPQRDAAEAYLFYDNGALDLVVGSDQAIRWSAEVWEPGSTLVWTIEDGPDWTLVWDSAQDVVPLVEEALSRWSEIPTADISWRLAGVSALDGYRARFRNSSNQVYIDPEGGFAAELWWGLNLQSGVWELTECDIGLPPDLVEHVRTEHLSAYTGQYVMRELGHCLGLGIASSLPGSESLHHSPSDDGWIGRESKAMRPEPAMSLGSGIALDDRVGASLVRPRAGWIEGTGILSGVLEAGGERVPYGYVWAFRRTSEGMRDPVGAFANADGEFLIEGLTPGDYALWAHPVIWYRSHRFLIERGAEWDVEDSVLAHPLRVDAGRVTDGIVIPMQRGRE